MKAVEEKLKKSLQADGKLKRIVTELN